jgi:hypothetical protein
MGKKVFRGWTSQGSTMRDVICWTKEGVARQKIRYLDICGVYENPALLPKQSEGFKKVKITVEVED